MREKIGLYHGKRKDNGEWAKGYYACIAGNNIILTGKIDITNGVIGAEAFEVFPESVGEFAGITDKNKIEIFEGDIVRDDENKIYVIIFVNGVFRIAERRHNINFYSWSVHNYSDYFTVIGNIYDNPELLKEE